MDNIFVYYNIKEIIVFDSSCGGHTIILTNDKNETVGLDELSTYLTKALLNEFKYYTKATKINIEAFENVYGKV